VVNENGDPLKVYRKSKKETNIGTSTNANGEFSFMA